MRYVLAALLASLLFAPAAHAGTITDLTVAIDSPSAATNARTTYAIGFATSATGALTAGQTIEVDMPTPTSVDTATMVGGSVSVGGTQVGSCPTKTATAVTCIVDNGRSIAASTAVQLKLNGLTNPATANLYTLQAHTSTDVASAATFTVVASQQFAQPALTNSFATAAGARTEWTTTFTTTSTGGLSQAAGSQITLTFPTGTDLTTVIGGSISVAGTPVGSCPTRNGLLVTCVFNTGATIAPSTAVKVTVDGLTNPPAGQASATVATTSDQSRASSSITITAAANVQNVQLLNTGSSSAGARTNYVTTFDLPAGSDLAAAANSQIKVSFPNGNDLTHTVAGTIEDTTAGTTVGSCPTRDDVNKLVTCVFNTGASIPGGHSVRVTIDGVTNVESPGNVAVAVSTTSDPALISSNNVITITAGTAVGGLTVSNTSPTAAASARTTYVAQFTVSPTGAMSADANSLIVIGIGGALIQTPVGGTVRDTTAGRDVGSCPTHSTTTLTCVLNTGVTIANGHALTVTLNVVGNPDTPGTYGVSVATTSDQAGASANVDVVASHQVAQLIGAPADNTPGKATTYALDFHTSSTGGMSAAAQSQISITFPTGTVFANQAGGTIVDGANGQSIGSCPAHGGLVLLCSFNNGVTVPAGHDVKVTATGLTNPTTTGTYSLQLVTTSDTSASIPIGIGQAAALPETTIQPTADGGFAFTSPEPGATFQCSLDGGQFVDCTSPFRPPADLPAGDHTLRVRAIDVAGDIDPTPAAQTFTVASTPAATPTPVATPAPTPTATPTPTPVPNQTVVAAPISGTVLVQLPGTHTFVRVSATEGIPLGSTVDTRHGVVQITAAGGGVAKFYDGLFKITQAGGVTILTLTEQLAPCGKSGHAGAAAKKPKTRKLWGDGHGAFSTRGQYSAATVRGTLWLVQDSCAGTLTRVKTGVVAVRDNVKKKTVLLKAGKSYIAKPRK